ncbi:MAG: 5-(carboxyamino)imidazole ribonucleotide mutase, partial [Candidatus Latescibacteria bacterium]|nr:5-(carboxyamino)imidazole ribonucleotide mutase [Candidatus Latescibacterota bacterium]
MGSPSDQGVMDKAVAVLDELGITHETVVSSAHRNPERTATWASGAAGRGIKVIIAGAGLAAALPGVVAAHTTVPVIGVPIASGALNGVDSLYSIVQMPPGVPVATVGIDNSRNAAV